MRKSGSTDESTAEIILAPSSGTRPRAGPAATVVFTVQRMQTRPSCARGCSFARGNPPAAPEAAVRTGTLRARELCTSLIVKCNRIPPGLQSHLASVRRRRSVRSAATGRSNLPGRAGGRRPGILRSKRRMDCGPCGRTGGGTWAQAKLRGQRRHARETPRRVRLLVHRGDAFGAVLVLHPDGVVAAGGLANVGGAVPADGPDRTQRRIAHPPLQRQR